MRKPPDMTRRDEPSPSYRWGLAVEDDFGYVIRSWFKTKRAAVAFADSYCTTSYAIADWFRRK